MSNAHILLTLIILKLISDTQDNSKPNPIHIDLEKFSAAMRLVGTNVAPSLLNLAKEAEKAVLELRKGLPEVKTK